MIRRAPLLAVLVLALAGCPATRNPGATTPPASEPAGGEAQAPSSAALVGSYRCRFARGEIELEPTTCAIRASDDGTLRLEQPGGPLRLGGTVTSDEAGFRLTGEIQCSLEPCPPPGTRDLLFYAQAPGAYSAVLPLTGGELLNIDLTRAD